MIKYSVVIPMYNSEDTIVASLNSIYSQTKFELIDEIVIVDDGSKDNSVSVVKEFMNSKNDSKIKLIEKVNGGAASARNVGIRNAKNEFIALLDADDEWLENKLEVQNQVLIENPTIKSIGSNRVGEIVHRGNEVVPNVYHLTPFEYCVKNWPCTPSLIFSKNIFENDMYFDESLSHAEEGIFYLDIAARSGLYYHADALVLCGGGKPAYGHSGLSGNIKKMHIGIKNVMKKAHNKGYLTKLELLFLCLYEDLKYMRRILIMKLRSK